MPEIRPRPMAAVSLLVLLAASAADAAPPVYATWLGGGASAERTYAAAAGPGGTLYVAGRTLSPNFPFTPGGPIVPSFQAPPQGQPFVARIDPSVPGPAGLLFADFLGGTLADGGGEARGVAVDGAGNVYVVGFHTGHSMPVVGGMPHASDHNNAFLVKLSPDGHTILYSTYIGGSNNVDELDEIVVDDSGVATVAGRTASSNFFVRGAFAGPPQNGLFDAFVMRIDTKLTGNDSVLWSTCFGGSANDAAISVAVGPTGLVYLTGMTNSWAPGGKIPLTANALSSANGGGDDSYLAVLDPSITGPAALVYSTYLGGQYSEEAGAIDVDLAGAAYVAGSTMSPNFPTTPGVWDTTLDQTFGPATRTDGYVAKLDPFAPAGATLVWSTLIGGVQNEFPRDLELDSGNRPVIAGSSQSAEYPRTGCSAAADSSTTAFVTRFTATGQLDVSQTFGGLSTDFGEGLALLPGGRFLVAGSSASPTLPTTAGAVQPAKSGGADDAFLAVLWDCSSCPPGLFLDGGVCHPCPAGTASPDGGACRPCAAGTFAGSEGSAACEACPCGTSSGDGASACTLCAAGTASDDGVSCDACPAGSSSFDGACACSACGPGTQASAAQDGCEVCPPGTHSPDGQACLACPPGEVAPFAGAATCDLCGCGSVPSADQASCAPCAAGSASSNGLTCDACPAGTYSFAGACGCESCPIGTEPNADHTGCQLCAPGTYSPDGSACAACPDGTVSLFAGAPACEACPCGTEPGADHASCDACAAGTSSDDGLSCDACLAGYSTAGACACSTCGPGTAANADHTGCELCAAGTYSPDGASCLACPAGTSSSAGAVACAATCQPDQLAALESPGLTPAFAPGTSQYHVPPGPSSSTWVKATLCNPALKLYVGGNQVASGAQVGAWLGNGSVSVSLYAGWTQVGSYTLVVDPALPEAPLTQGLASLVTSGLTPAFDPAITDYTAKVKPGWVTQVTATTTNPAYTLYIDSVAVASGATFNAWAPPGATIDVSVYLGWMQIGDYDVLVVP